MELIEELDKIIKRYEIVMKLYEDEDKETLKEILKELSEEPKGEKVKIKL